MSATSAGSQVPQLPTVEETLWEDPSFSVGFSVEEA